MNKDDKFKIIKQLLAEGYEGSISEYIAKIEQQEIQAMQAQAQAQAEQGQANAMPTPALAGNLPTPPQQSSTERNIIQPGQYKFGGIKLNTRMDGCKECGGFHEDGGPKEIGDTIKYDEKTGQFFNMEIQKSFEQRRGRFDPSFIHDPEHYKQWKQDQQDQDVRFVEEGGFYDEGGEKEKQEIKLNTSLSRQPINLHLNRFRDVKNPDLMNALTIGGATFLGSTGIRNISTNRGQNKAWQNAYDAFINPLGGQDWVNQVDNLYCADGTCPLVQSNLEKMLGSHSRPDLEWFKDPETNVLGKDYHMSQQNVRSEEEIRKQKITNILKGGRDAVIAGGSSYILNKALDNTKWGRKLQKKIGMDINLGIFKQDGGVRTYENGGDKKGTTEFSLCSPIMDSNGNWFSSCANREYAPLHNVYLGKNLTVGKKGDDMTTSAALTAGYEFHPKGGTGNITGHIGGKYGVRSDNLMSRHIDEAPEFSPFSQITGSLGYEGEIGDVHSYKRYLQGRRGIPLRWGTGVYAKQNLLGDKSTTVGLYGNIGQFTGSFGYNPQTGPEATLGFGFNFREKGGPRHPWGIPPPTKTDSTYTHIPMDSLINRQQFKESEFDSDAVSTAGARGISQITKQTYEEGKKKGWISKDVTYAALIKSDELSTEFHKNYINDLLKRSWNKGTPEVKRAKALAAYNMGPTRFVNVLNAMKKDGYDIYENTLWIEDLPKYHKYLKGSKKGQSITETRDYIKTLMYGDHEKKFIETSPDGTKSDTLSWEDRYKRAYEKKDGGGFKYQLNTNPYYTAQVDKTYVAPTYNYEDEYLQVDPIFEQVKKYENLIKNDFQQGKYKKTVMELIDQEEENIMDPVEEIMIPNIYDAIPAVRDKTNVVIPNFKIDPDFAEAVKEWEDKKEKIKEEQKGVEDINVEKENIRLTQNRNKNKNIKINEKIREEAAATLEELYGQYKKIDYDDSSADKVKAIQQILVDNGYNIGPYGPNRDGIDGKFGNKTRLAYLDYLQSKLSTKTPITFHPDSRDEACDANGCAAYVSSEFMNEGYDVDYMEIGGNAWTMYDQMVSKGGALSKYNIFNNSEFKNKNLSQSDIKKLSINAYKNGLKNGDVNKNTLKPGDVVGLIKEVSANWDNAYEETTDGYHFYGDKIKHKTYNSHVGFVSGYDKNGEPIISHSIGGIVFNDKWDNITGGGIAWIASPNSSKPVTTFDYTENTEEFNNAEYLDFFDEKNFEGQINNDGTQKTYNVDQKRRQNDAINYIKNNTPIILDELDININGIDGEKWLMEAVIGIGMHETGLGTNMPDAKQIRKERKINNLAKFGLDDASLDEGSFSLGITKIKLNGFGRGSRDYYDVNTTNINFDDKRALAITIDNLARNYRMLELYAAKNPQLGLTEEDIRNMTILSHNRGLLAENKAGGGTGTNFGQRNDMTLEEQIDSLRTLYEGNLKDHTQTKWKHVPFGEIGYDYFNPEGNETYISKVNRYINKQISPHHANIIEEGPMQKMPMSMLYDPTKIPTTARFGGYKSKYGW